MSNGDDKSGPGGSTISAADRESIKARAEAIDKRLSEARGRITPKSTVESQQRGQAMGKGLRIAVDLVVGVAFGGFVGWWLDRYFGSAPWLMVVMLMLGFAAGMMNVIRTAQRMQAEAEASQRSAPSVKDDPEDDN